MSISIDNINYEDQMSGFLDITFGPKWDYIPVTRSYVENFLSLHSLDKGNISKIEMTASELLENAVKYSSKDGIRMIIRKDEKNKQVELMIFNFTDEEAAGRLMKGIDDMNAKEPLEYYITRIKNSKKFKAEHGHKGAGLGLARIYHEANGKISYAFDKQKGILEIKAIIGYE